MKPDKKSEKEVKRRENSSHLLKHGNSSGKPNNAPRCGAKKRHKATFCEAPAMKNGRCRLHGGLSTGPKTAEGIQNSKKANFKHGLYSAANNAFRKFFNQQTRSMRATLAEI